MTADNRTVHTDALATLGTIIDETQKRDAIHLAVLPMQAKTTLQPGERVDREGRAPSHSSEYVGIVDPFLSELVRPGQWFWLVIKPRVITSLRHVWAHPAFPDEAPVATERSPSEQWMREWAIRHVSESYYGDRPAEEAYKFAIQAGFDLNLGSNESAREYIDDTWWTHWEIITGQPGKRGEYFSCAC